MGIRLAALALVSSAALPLTGCGATVSTYLILSAQAEVDGAEAAEAPKYAPYEYRSAKEYLHKSREEQGYADFGPSIEYAFRAKEMAERGKERALSSKRREVPPTSPTTIVNEPVVEEPVTEAPAPSKPIIIKKVEPAPVEEAPEETPDVPIVPITPAPAPAPKPKTP